jgi:hypothetical protein
MKRLLILLAVAVCAFAAPPFDFKLLDKLGANAKSSNNITLDGPVLKMAGGLVGKSKDGESVKSLIAGLKGIYIRSYEFDAEGQYNEGDLEPLRTWLDSQHWSKIVDTKSGREKASIYILPMPDGQFGGLAIVAAEAKEVSVVFIDGQISPDDIGKLGGNLGIPDLSGIDKDIKKAAKGKKEE